MSVERTPDDDPSVDSMLREAAATVALGVPSQFAGTERFALGERIGEGGFGVVFEAIDRSDGRRVALKLLRRPHAERLYRFKREFRALAELVHPNLVRLHDLFAAGRDLFFTMERIDGTSLRERVAVRPDTLLDLLRQLAEGVAALHRHGKLHRDVKPSNILVDREGRVVLLDFGLAIDKDEHATSELAGTPLYMSPEQCAGEPLTEASDWYAFGVVAFELLTHALPFTGAAQQVIDRKRHEPAPRARTVADVAPELDELCAALLARDPRARPTGDEVLRRLRGAPPPPVKAEQFVGRAAELAALLARFERAQAGQCVVTLARGPSGIGKSALLRRCVETIRRRRPDALVLAGRCYERESVPYKALDAVVDELATLLRRMPAPQAAALLPRDAHALEQLFPVLRQVPAFHETRERRHELGDPADVRARGMAALRELFARLADRWPVVVCVDDLQWGDVDSALLLAELLRAPDAPAVFWLATFRAEEATTSPLLQRLDQLRTGPLRDVELHELALAGLDRDDAHALATALLADRGDAARARAIALESGGSPFFVQELSRLGDGAHALADVVRARVARLDATARRLLEVIAVAARPVEVEVVAAAAAVDAALRPALATLRAEHMIRIRDASSERPHKLVETYHDRIREAVVHDLAADTLRATHRHLAAALEARRDSDPAQIGRHLADGGEPQRAIVFLVRAAERAATSLAFDEAARLYQHALALSAQGTQATDVVALELACASALAAADRGPEAVQHWKAVVDRVAEPQRTDLRRRIAEELLLSGEIDEGYAVLGSVLADLGLAMPRTRTGALVRAGLGRVRGALVAHRLRDRPTPPSARELQRVDTLGSMVWATTLFDPVMAAALQAQYLPLALQSGDAMRATFALSLDAALAALQGADAVAARGLAYARELAPLAGEAPMYALDLAEGLVDLLEGRWTESPARLVAVEHQAFRISMHGSIRVMVHLTQMMNLFWMGRSGDALRRLPALIDRLDRRGNINGWSWFTLLHGWALSCSGRLAEAWDLHAQVAARLPARGFQVLRWYMAFGQVKYLVLEDDIDEAWRRLAEAERATRFSFIGPLQRISKAWVHATTALLRGVRHPALRPAMLADARRELRRLEREPAAWVRAVAHSLRACIASVAGRADDALRLLAEAEPLLETYRLEAALAATRVVRGRLVGGETGAAITARGEAWLAAQQASPAIARLLVPGLWSAP